MDRKLWNKIWSLVLLRSVFHCDYNQTCRALFYLVISFRSFERYFRVVNSIQFFISIHSEQYNFLLFIKLSMSLIMLTQMNAK